MDSVTDNVRDPLDIKVYEGIMMMPIFKLSVLLLYGFWKEGRDGGRGVESSIGRALQRSFHCIQRSDQL